MDDVRAAALRDLLAELPDDMLILLNGKHVTYISRGSERRGPTLRSEPHKCDCGHNHTHYVGEASVTYPAHLDICTRWNTPSWHQAEPAVEFCGRWTKAARSAIDRHSDDPDANVLSEVRP